MEGGSTSVSENHENHVNSTQPTESKSSVPASFNVEKELDRVDRKVLKEVFLAFMKAEPASAEKLRELLFKESHKGKAPATTTTTTSTK